MAVILGEETVDDYNAYRIGGGVEKLWECPRCKHDFFFCFHGDPPWPPLSLPCPYCGRESPIPWRKPPMVSWKCQNCGHVQKASRRCWKSPDKEYTVIFLDVKETSQRLFCNRCFMPATYVRGAFNEVLDVVGDVGDVVGKFADGIRRFFGWETAAAQKAELDRMKVERLKNVEREKRAFDRFLKKVPQLRAEQERLAEEERQKAALEAKARQEELRLLKKQATTAAGLKRMKPTNFELAVASLYLKLGYNVYLTPTSSDRGIDLVAIKDKERIAVQCKRYKRTVPVSQVRDFYGSFVGTYNRGIFVTSSEYSQATREWAEERQGLELLNGKQLAKLFVEHNPKIVSNVEKWKEHPLGRD